MVRNFKWFWVVAAMLAGAGACDSGTSGVAGPGKDLACGTPVEVKGSGAFAGPQGLAVSGDLIFVANPDIAYDSTGTATYGDGFVTVVSATTRTVLAKVVTSTHNPQAVAVAGGKVWVLCSGETAYDATAGVVSPTSDGALEAFDLATAATATATTTVVPLPKGAGLVGDPASMVVTSDGGTAYLGSGTSAAVYKVDLAQGKLLRGADNPIALATDLTTPDGIVMRPGPGTRLLATSYDRDTVFLFDPATDAVATSPWSSAAVGKTAGQLEGAVDVLYADGEDPDVFVLLTIGNSVSTLSSATGPASVRTGWMVTGQYANRLVQAGAMLLVVNSGDNNVTTRPLDGSAATRTLAVLPTGANPYDLAVRAAGAATELWISGEMSDSVFVATCE